MLDSLTKLYIMYLCINFITVSWVPVSAAGIDSIFVLGGIHAKELGLVPSGSDDNEIVIVDDNVGKDSKYSITKRELITQLDSFFEMKGVYPTHVVPSLSL